MLMFVMGIERGMIVFRFCIHNNNKLNEIKYPLIITFVKYHCVWLHPFQKIINTLENLFLDDNYKNNSTMCIF
jgi:hypothetical protein